MTGLMLVVSEGYIRSRSDGFASKVLAIDVCICEIAGRTLKIGPYLLIEDG